MWSKDDLDTLIKDLEENQREGVSVWLRVMLEDNEPTCDEKVVTLIEKLLTDTRACMVRGSMPPLFGQMRWLAARILVREYACLGKEKSLLLEEVAEPLTNAEFITLLANHHSQIPRYDPNKPYERMYIAFEELVKQGVIPLRQIEFVADK